MEKIINRLFARLIVGIASRVWRCGKGQLSPRRQRGLYMGFLACGKRFINRLEGREGSGKTGLEWVVS